MAAPIRAFLAIQPPKDIRAELAGLNLGGLRRIPQDNIHLTIRFLGVISARTLEQLTLEMDQLARTLSPIEIEIENISGFPASGPTVIAAAVSSNTKLTQLAEFAESMVRGIGLGAEPRPFRPHITIARVPRAVNRVPDFRHPMQLSFTAGELVLFSSEPGRGGVAYVRMHAAKFED